LSERGVVVCHSAGFAAEIGDVCVQAESVFIFSKRKLFFLFNILRLFSFRVVWCSKMYVAKKLFTEQLILYLSTVTEIVCVSRVVCPFFLRSVSNQNRRLGQHVSGWLSKYNMQVAAILLTAKAASLLTPTELPLPL